MDSQAEPSRNVMHHFFHFSPSTLSFFVFVFSSFFKVGSYRFVLEKEKNQIFFDFFFFFLRFSFAAVAEAKLMMKAYASAVECHMIVGVVKLSSGRNLVRIFFFPFFLSISFLSFSLVPVMRFVLFPRSPPLQYFQFYCSCFLFLLLSLFLSSFFLFLRF